MTALRLGIPGLGVVLLLGCATPSSSQRASDVPPAKSAVDVVQSQLDAFNAQDLEAFLATYADDAIITSASTGKVVMEGKAVMRERYGSMFKKYPNNRCRIAERRTEGDKVVLDHEIITGRAPEKPDPWDFGWVRYEVERGLIRRVQFP
jgi:uncharacterized protein (TIGR02246 family)